MRRLWAGLRQQRPELLLSRCYDYRSEGISLRKHRELGRIETQVVRRHDHGYWQQRRQQDSGDG